MLLLLSLLACDEQHPPRFDTAVVACADQDDGESLWSFQAQIWDQDGLDDVHTATVSWESPGSSGSEDTGSEDTGYEETSGTLSLRYLFDGLWKVESSELDLRCSNRADATFVFTTTDTEGLTDALTY